MIWLCAAICLQLKVGYMKNHSAGHISSEEAAVLVDYLNEQLAEMRK
jgi:hypothetical protein